MPPMPISLRRLLPRTDYRTTLDDLDVSGLDVSSLELDIRTTPNTQDTSSSLPKRDGASFATLSPLSARDLLTPRDTPLTTTFTPGQGSRPPGTFNNQAFLALFATLGALMVLASIWFFFWAKNGGFRFQQGSWDDYKSTVLRRKGPDGKTLSNATKSTKLGGSTIVGTQHYKWAKQTAKTVVSRDEKGRKGVLGKRGWGKTHSVTYSDDYLTESFGTETVSDEMAEVRSEPDYSNKHLNEYHSKRYRDRDRDVQQYKKERPARVGGLNRIADGSHVDTTNTDVSSTASETPIIKKHKRSENSHNNRSSKDVSKPPRAAERTAREEAARMERRWKKEAEEAAAALARENARAIPAPKKSAQPASKPSATKQRQASRSNSPRKRESAASYAPTEVLSTAYTGTTTTGNRSASYYDSYRPRATSESPRFDNGYSSPRRQSSPKKKAQGQQGRSGGYRRGADSDFD